AFRHSVRGIALEECAREIRIALADLLFVRRGVGWRLRQEEAQRADLAVVEPCEDRYLRLFAAVEDIDELSRQDAPIDSTERKPACAGRPVGDRHGVHRAQAGEVARAQLAGEPYPGGLAGHIPKRRAPQL